MRDLPFIIGKLDARPAGFQHASKMAQIETLRLVLFWATEQAQPGITDRR
jgi:hypothetical protein